MVYMSTKYAAEIIGTAWILFSVAAPIAAALYLARRLQDLSDKKHGEWRRRGSGMRRWCSGQWQYRPLSDSEIDVIVQEQSDRAW